MSRVNLALDINPSKLNESAFSKHKYLTSVTVCIESNGV